MYAHAHTYVYSGRPRLDAATKDRKMRRLYVRMYLCMHLSNVSSIIVCMYVCMYVCM